SFRRFLLLFTAPPRSSFSPLSLHDALPIYQLCLRAFWRRSSFAKHKFGVVVTGLDLVLHRLANELGRGNGRPFLGQRCARCKRQDRKSTRLNSSHVEISYAVFCLKKKKKNT